MGTLYNSHDLDQLCEPAWYAVMVKTRLERITGNTLERQGYEAFVPTCSVRRLRGNRYRRCEVVLFPSYVFCRFREQLRLPILMTPGVKKIVGTSGGLIRVREDEIAALQTIVDSGVECQPWPSVSPGAWVEITRGPLKGIRGSVQNVRSGYRFILSVTGLHRSIAVSVDRDLIRPIAAPAYSRCG
jgi:transcription antitermination factor NusG